MLPLMQTPTFSTYIPSINQEVLMRPFLVKEEKILLLAKQSNDKDQILLSIQQVVQNCLIDQEYDIGKLPFFDVEYLFIQLRINSIGDDIKIKIRDEDIDEDVEATISLNDLDISVPEEDNEVVLNSSTSMILKYPTLKDLSKVDTSNEVSSFFSLLKSCILTVVHNDTIYEFDNYSEEEKDEYIESLSMDYLNKCRGFITNLPSVQIPAKWTVKGKKKEKMIKGMNSFF